MVGVWRKNKGKNNRTLDFLQNQHSETNTHTHTQNDQSFTSQLATQSEEGRNEGGGGKKKDLF